MQTKAYRWTSPLLLLMLSLALGQHQPPSALPSNSLPPVENKIFAHYVVDRSTLLLRRKIFLFRDELYTPWSVWSNCSLKDCTELRYRQCINDSYENWIPNLFLTNNCPFQYIAETRRCVNETQCEIRTVPSKALQELANTCGKKSGRRSRRTHSTKIIGGREAKPHNWPWQVALYARPHGEGRYMRSPKSEAPFCGATLIAPSWLITAAHCLSELAPEKEFVVGQVFSVEDELDQEIRARLGDHDRGKREPFEVSRTVEYAIIHPDFQKGFSERGFDVALLKMSEPVELNDGVNSICVADKSLRLPEGHVCYAAGWGAISPDPKPAAESPEFLQLLSSYLFPRPCGRDQSSSSSRKSPKARQPLRLLEVGLPLVSLQRCRKTYQNLQEWVHVCAGEKGKDTCRGDSGGGLFCQSPEDGRWYLYGVTSFGSVLGCGEHYGVYTCTRGMSDWIHENVQ